jgi:DNA adenine methylase
VEPFAGGGAVSLAAVFEGSVERALLLELDPDVSAVWETLLSTQAPRLAEAVMDFDCSAEGVSRVLESVSLIREDRAFRTLVLNRVRYGGILAAGAAQVRRGENGKGIKSRWYPATLRKRILAISAKKDRLRFVSGDGVEFLRRAARYRNAAFFIDPPYTVAGRRLYTYNEIDHEELFSIASRLSGDFLMTYDNSAEIRHLAQRSGFQTQLVPMQSTKHEMKYELLIGRNLEWARVPLLPELLEDALLKNLQANGKPGG